MATGAGRQPGAARSSVDDGDAMGDMSDHAQSPLGYAPLLRRLPHNTDAERAVIGAILVDNSTFHRVSTTGLEPEHFVLSEHARIFGACSELISGGRVADPITLRGWFDQSDSLAQVGGAASLIQIADCAVPARTAADYGRMLVDLYQRRELIALGEDVVNRAYVEEIGDDAERQISDARRALAAAALGPTGSTRPFCAVDASALSIPEPRQWLLGTLLCRKFVTLIAAPGGVGKTSLGVSWALSLAVGRALTGDYVHRRCRVLIVTAEDGIDELSRRIHAARMHHGVTLDDSIAVLCLVEPGGSDSHVGVKLVEPDDSGQFVESAYVPRLIATARAHRADVVIMDPFVKLSGAPENDNTASDQAMSAMSRWAISENVAILLLHHVSKGGMVAGDMDKARGASAAVDAARIGLTMTTMSSDEASRMDVSEDDRLVTIRLDSGKANLARRSAAAAWYRLCEVNIGNSTPEYPSGDNVQAIERWTPPDLWEGLPSIILNRILDDISNGLNGELYSDNSRAGERSAWLVIQRHVPEKTEEQCREIIRTWKRNGLLKVVQYESEKQRKTREGFAVNDGKRPS